MLLNTNFTLVSITLITLLGASLAALILFENVFLVIIVACLISFYIYFHMLRKFDVWQRNVILLLGGYLILTRGFSYTGLRIGDFYIFIGEIIIILTLLIKNFKRDIKKFISDMSVKCLLIWAFLGLVLASVSIYDYKLISVARDFAMVYYAIFALFGYAFYKSRENLIKFFDILGWIFAINIIVCFLFQWTHVLEAFSPKMMELVPLFYMRNDAYSVTLMGGVLYFGVIAPRYKWPRAVSLVLILVQICLILILKARAAYVGASVTFLLHMLITRKRLFLNAVTILLMIVAMITIINPQSLDVNRADEASIASINKEIASIFDPDKSGTASFRLLWWKILLDESFSNTKLLLFGRGFGPSLTIYGDLDRKNFSRRNEEIAGLAKSPHNIIMTIFARMGLAGLLLWLVFNFLFFLKAIKGINLFRLKGDRENFAFVSWITCFFCMILVTSMFGVLLESPFIAIPYFFFMGLGLAILDKNIGLNGQGHYFLR